MEELWKAIPDTNGRFLVSSFARILDVGHPRCKTPKLRVPKCNNDVLKVRIIYTRYTQYSRVMNLVAFAFLGSLPQEKMLALKDGDFMNCKLSNLHYVDFEKPGNAPAQHLVKEKISRTVKSGNIESFPGEIWKIVPCTDRRFIFSNRGRLINRDFKGTGEYRLVAPHLHGKVPHLNVKYNGRGRGIGIDVMLDWIFDIKGTPNVKGRKRKFIEKEKLLTLE